MPWPGWSGWSDAQVAQVAQMAQERQERQKAARLRGATLSWQAGERYAAPAPMRDQIARPGRIGFA